MKGKPPSPGSKRTAPAQLRRSGFLALLVIDERPIRKKAFKEYEKAERRVAKARDEIEAFETRDLPAFSRWEAQMFGQLMSELREVTTTLMERTHLLDLISAEMFWTRCSRVAAYRRVIEARTNPTPPPTRPDSEFEGSGFDPKGGGDQTTPKVFGDSDLPPDFNIDAFDSLSPRKQNEVYEAYEDAALLFEMIYGVEAPQFTDLLQRERERCHVGKAEEPRASEHHIPLVHQHQRHFPPGREGDRIKELYRTLVRRLHPDTGASQTARERDLWQQVQDAYKTRDLEWLEAIHGRLEALHQGGASLSIQTLRRMTADLLSAYHGLRSQLSKHRHHPAWKFHDKTAALAKFETERRRELEDQLACQRAELNEAERVLKDLAERAAKPQKPKKKTNRSTVSPTKQDLF